MSHERVLCTPWAEAAWLNGTRRAAGTVALTLGLPTQPKGWRRLTPGAACFAPYPLPARSSFTFIRRRRERAPSPLPGRHHLTEEGDKLVGVGVEGELGSLTPHAVA